MAGQQRPRPLAMPPAGRRGHGSPAEFEDDQGRIDTKTSLLRHVLELMSNVIRKPFVPLNSNALSPAREASTVLHEDEAVIPRAPQYLRF